MSDTVIKKEINIAILGDKNVGKTKLCELFCCNRINSNRNSETIEDCYLKLLSLKDGDYLIKINEVGGSNDCKKLLSQTIKKCSCFIIVFSITDSGSFNNIQYYYDKIKKKSNFTNPPILLVCNKVDLQNPDKHLRVLNDYSKTLCVPYQITNYKDVKSTSSMFLKIIEIHPKINSKEFKQIKTIIKHINNKIIYK